MSVKDSMAGTAKRLVAEIVGDGKLADEGTRQGSGVASPPSIEVASQETAAGKPPEDASSASSHAALGEDNRFASLMGLAALKVWAELPRDAQERLFAAAVDDGVIANDLAEFLHDRHPRTAHPPKPTRFA